MSQQHQALRLLVQGDIVAVQPAAAKGATADTLSVQLSTGKVGDRKVCGEALYTHTVRRPVIPSFWDRV